MLLPQLILQILNRVESSKLVNNSIYFTLLQLRNKTVVLY